MAKQPSRPKKPAKKPAPPAGGTKPRKQFGIGFTPSMAKRIDATAAALQTDGANLLRMIIAEHLHEYEARAKRVRDAAPPE